MKSCVLYYEDNSIRDRVYPLPALSFMPSERIDDRRKRKELEPESWGVLVTLDHTPFYGSDALQAVLEKAIYDTAQVQPYWHATFQRGVSPTFTDWREIHWALANTLNEYGNARFYHPYPNVSVLAGSPLSELAWVKFWKETEFLTPEETKVRQGVILGLISEDSGGNPLPDISCVMLLSREHVLSTAPQRKPVGWLLDGPPEGIALLNECFRQTIAKHGNYFPNLFVLDLEHDPKLGSELKIDLGMQFQLLAGYISNRLHSHQPIPFKYEDSERQLPL